MLLTHDVELAEGQARVDALAQLEEARGLRSCWNFVVQRYAVDTGLVADLQARGHEVGIHGVYHDGKLFASEAGFRKRLAIMVDAAERWGANGFRSPSLIYERTMLEQLPFRWDSSMPSWDPFQPKPGDCRRFVPFALNDQCIELPVTLWQDFTLFEELRFRDIEIWRQQVTRLYECGALINVIVHPDYMLTAGRVGLYTELLDLVQAHRDIVSTTPAALAQWHLRTDGSASGTELE